MALLRRDPAELADEDEEPGDLPRVSLRTVHLDEGQLPAFKIRRCH